MVEMAENNKVTNYDVYFGTQQRAIDSLSLLLEFPNAYFSQQASMYRHTIPNVLINILEDRKVEK
jgi:hypothetical protein